MMYTFKKEERLCNKRLIDSLFHNGSSFLCYPYRVSWRLVDTAPAHAQVVFGVAKKRFKKAVDRNLIKRRMREAYRLHKQQFLYDVLKKDDKRIALSIGYIGKGMEDFVLMEKKMIKLFVMLTDELSK